MRSHIKRFANDIENQSKATTKNKLHTPTITKEEAHGPTTPATNFLRNISGKRNAVNSAPGSSEKSSRLRPPAALSK